MTAPAGGRYAQLLAALPGGDYYRGRGVIVPFRGAEPHELRLEGAAPLTTYDVTIAGAPAGQVTTDAAGVALVRAVLPQADALIQLVAVTTGATLRAYFTARMFASWYAAAADVFEAIDLDLADARAALAISTMPARLAEEAQGFRVGAPNSSQATIEGYRIAVAQARRAYRVWGGRPAGVRAALESVLSSTPLLVPRAWRPIWAPPPEDAGVGARTRLATATALPNLDLPALSYLHPGVAGTAPLTFPGPFAALPYGPALVAVRFAAGYDGEDITVEGLDQTGLPASEVITAGAYPVAATIIVSGLVLFSSVTRATKAAVGASGATASLGLAVDRFVRVLEIGPRNVTGARALAWDVSARELTWGGGTPVVLDMTLQNDGSRARYVVGDTVGRLARLRGYPSTISTATRDRLYLDFDRIGQVAVVLVTGAPAPTPAQVATDVMAWVDHDTRYGGARATGALTITDAATVADGETFTATDARGNVVTFEFDNDATVTPGNVAVDLTGAPTDAELAARVADAARGAGTFISAYIDPADDTICVLYQVLAGTAGNTTITDGGTTTGWTHAAAFAGGTNSTLYGAAGAIAAAVAGGLGNVVELRGVAAGGQVRVGRGPRNAAAVALGRPRAATTLSAGAAAGALALTATSGAALPSVPRPIELVAPFADNVASAAPTVQPGRATALQVHFTPAWAGGDIEVRGADCLGATTFERFAYVEDVIATGDGVESGDSGPTLERPGGFPTSIRTGDWIRIESGPVAGEIRQVAWVGRDYAGLVGIRMRTAFSADPSDASWTALREVVAVGSVVFETLTSVVSIAPAGAGAGRARVWTAGGEAEVIPLEVGRDRVSQSGTAALTFAPLTLDATIADITLTGYTARVGDVGGYVRITGATTNAGANNGLHRLIIQPYDIGGAAVRIEHERAQYGKSFVAETTAGTATWTVYAGGEVVGLLARATNTLTLAYPGLLTPLANGDPVESDTLPTADIGRATGAGELVVDVDPRYAPAIDASDNVTLVGETTPDGWLPVLAAADYGTLPPYGLRVVSAGGGDAQLVLARDVPTHELAGWEIVLRAVLAQHISASEDFRLDVSFDRGRTWSNGTATAVAGTAEGTPAATQVSRTVELPARGTVDPFGVRARVVHVGAGAAEVWRLDRFSIAGRYQDTRALNGNVIGRALSPQDRVLVYWPPEVLNADELHTIEAHVGRISAQAVTAAAYDADSSVVGCYDESAWATAALEGFELVLSTPPRFSHLALTRATWAEQDLVVGAPSDAALDVPADIEAPFPAPPPYLSRLDRDGDPVPSGSPTALRGSAAIGAGANGTVTLTARDEGDAGNAWTVEVAVPAGTAPLSVEVVDQAITVNLSVVGGVAVTDENRALYVAAEINRRFEALALLDSTSTRRPAVAAEASGTGATALATASGPTAFAGGDVAPWRLLDDSTLQIASVAAGDPADRDEYDAQAAYRLRYPTRIRATTAVLDLGADYADALWLVDAAYDLRARPDAGPIELQVELVFERTRRAVLDVAARSQDRSRASLSITRPGADEVVLPPAAWRFVDATTVELVAAAPESDALYVISYVGEAPVSTSAAVVSLEHRSATAAIDVLTAPWQAAERDQPVAHEHRYHQLRLTARDVQTTLDLTVRGLGLRALRVYGSDHFAPGMLACGD